MQRAPLSHGLLWPVIVPATTGVLLYFLLTFQLMFGIERPIVLSLAQVMFMAGGLYLALMVWAFLSARLAIGTGSGAGFAIAASGLLLRMLVGLEAYVDLYGRRGDAPSDPALALRVPAEILGTFAYGFGLTMVAVATLSAWRARRRELSA